MSALDYLLTQGEPGQNTHHMFVVAYAGSGPLGLPAFKSTGCTIVSDSPAVDKVTAQSIAALAVEHRGRGETIVFAGLALEQWTVNSGDKALAQRLAARGRLQDHPDAVEVTVVYGACRDGRRWRGQRWLTGPKAGRSEDVELLVGEPTAAEDGGPIRATPLLRALVGIGVGARG